MKLVNLKSVTVKISLCLLGLFVFGSSLIAQTANSKKRILIDIAHGQRFYNDPETMDRKDPAFVERIKYMTGELKKNASALNAVVDFQRGKITAADLKSCNLLFIHMPSAKYEAGEVEAIGQFLRRGGSLFLVMEVDYWATLAQSNVNDVVSPFGIVFKSDNPDSKSSGGYSDSGAVTQTRFKIPYHGARLVEGGEPFCFSNMTRDNPFGLYKMVKGGGRIIAMGDGMVSLYMTSWEGVNDYQCSPFMQEAFAWLLKK